MDGAQGLQLFALFVATLLLVPPFGYYMARVYENRPSGLMRWLSPLERLLYRLTGVKPEQEMDWKLYALSFMLFHIVGIAVLYVLMRIQQHLPLNPDGQAAVAPELALNTAISFNTNTNWQFYGGETTMTYLTQMAGLAVHNFLSPAAGIAVLVALIRGMIRKETANLGNFWADMVRGVVYVLLPLATVFALVLAWQGCPQTLGPAQKVALIQPTSYDAPVTDAAGNPVLDARKQPVTKKTALTEQVIWVGPVASQEAIKMVGTNGGGFFNVNSAHPFENPTPLTNFLELLAIILIPGALCWTFGVMVGDRRQGVAIFTAMLVILLPMVWICVRAELSGNPGLDRLCAGTTGQSMHAGNWEGKEVRFGIPTSAVWAALTTATSNGSVNAMHDSFTPMGGLMPMWLIQLGEVIFGGVGSGLYGMLVFVIVAVFIAGLMVGRTPEYLGKKIQAYEIKMASIVILTPPLLSLICTAIAIATDQGKAAMANPGAHGFSEVLYGFSSMANNNGSAFAGLSGNRLTNLLGAVAMWFGRFWLAVPALAIAGSLAEKKIVPQSAGTLPTHTVLFVVMLVSTVLIVGALVFFPALALGPIVEHLIMTGGHS